MSHGQAWMMAGEPARAVAAIDAALALTPEDPDLLMDRAIALSEEMETNPATTPVDEEESRSADGGPEGGGGPSERNGTT